MQPNFVFLAFGIVRRRNYLNFLGLKLWLYPFKEDIAVLGIFEESHVAVKAIETKLGQSLKWETKNTDSIVADNPKRPGFIEIRRVFMNSPLFETSANA